MLILDFLLLHQNTQNREVPELITHKYWFMLCLHYPGNKFPLYWISLKSNCRLCNRHAHTRAIPVRNLHFINWNDYRCFLTSELFCSDDYIWQSWRRLESWPRSVHVSHQEENKEYLYISSHHTVKSEFQHHVKICLQRVTGDTDNTMVTLYIYLLAQGRLQAHL